MVCCLSVVPLEIETEVFANSAISVSATAIGDKLILENILRIYFYQALCATCFLTPVFASAQADAPAPAAQSAPAEAVLEKILVSGVQPGPGMWKISKGDHALWIIATYDPVPKKMLWRAKEVEAIIAQSQEILGSVGIGISIKQIGYFKALTLIPALFESRKNPDGATLRDIVSADVYKRWLVLRDKYIGDYQDDDNDIERRRPMFAAMELYAKAIDQTGLTTRNPVRSVVNDLAKKYNVKITSVNLEPNIGEVRAAINEFKATRLADLECFNKTVERIEADLVHMRARANAWASGDVNALRTLPASDQRAACNAAIENAPFMKTLGIENARTLIEIAWLNAAELALNKNKVTLAILPIDAMFKPDYLAKLKAKGYTIQEPEGASE